MPQQCTRCQKRLAVWCRCYSDATIDLSLCETCLRGDGEKSCWICKVDDKRYGKKFGGCCYDCGKPRRCSKCDFFEYAPGHPIDGSSCPRCHAPFRTLHEVAVVHAAQSMDVEPRHDGSLCLSCLYLDRHVSQCRKAHSRSTWCRSCITLHTCKICSGISRDT